MKIFFLLLSLSSLSLAATANEVLIRGKIGNSFDEKSVTVIDSFNQVYQLPRTAFSKNFKFSQGKSFAIEIDEALLKTVKIKLPSN